MKQEKAEITKELKILLDDHQKYMTTLELFCSELKVDKDLNSVYLQLLKKMTESLNSQTLSSCKISIYKPFEGDLYTAESEWNEMNMILMREAGPVCYLSWEAIKPFLYQTHSEILKSLSENDMNSNTVDVEKILNNKVEQRNSLTDKSNAFYLVKIGDEFRYNNRALQLNKNTDYYHCICALYSISGGSGGYVDYQTLIDVILRLIPSKKMYPRNEIIKFIQTNLTTKDNGFIKKAEIKEIEDNGVPLIRVEHGTGINFNNRKG